jgi:ABC-2 type transport system permease protein
MSGAAATALHPDATGVQVMLRIAWRTHWRGAVVWTLALGATMTFTAVAVAGLYDTPAKIHSYATAVTSGSALQAINGHVEGIDSLGGVVQDEFGFLASFLLPLLGVSLVARSSRREEEAGRLETVLAGRVARHDPILAALALATAALLATGALFAAGLIAAGVPATGSLLYAASLATLGFVFAGWAALLAQVSLHSRTVYVGGLLALAVAYVLRGVGDVTGTWLTWLSPLGWSERSAPFGDQRWWALALPVALGAALAGAAVRLAARRDLGSALLRGGAGPRTAAGPLLRPLGFAAWLHRSTILGWLAGGLILTAMMGALAQQLLDAMAGNPALSEALGVAGGDDWDGFVSSTQLYLAVLATGYAVHAVSTLRAEEAEGRLETRLAGTAGRTRWLAAHGLVVLGGLLVVVVLPSLALALTGAWSTGRGVDLTGTIGAGLAYLPAEGLLAALALALYGARPRALGLAWLAYAVVTFVAFLGPGLNLDRWLLDLAPTTHVGDPPLGDVRPGALLALSALTVGLTAVGFLTFRRRRVPQG